MDTHKYIKLEIKKHNLNKYFETISIRGNGDCGFYSLIYFLNHYTEVQDFKKYDDKIKDGAVYYDKESVLSLRSIISKMYSTNPDEISKERSIKILNPNEWLQDNDLEMFSRYYKVCICLFQMEPYRMTIYNTNLKLIGLDGCDHVLFIKHNGIKKIKETFNYKSTSGIHFDIMKPATDVFQQATLAEITKSQDIFNTDFSPDSANSSHESDEQDDPSPDHESDKPRNSPTKQLTIKDVKVDLFYKQIHVDVLNGFIQDLNKNYSLYLLQKPIFYSSIPSIINATIDLNKSDEAAKTKKVFKKTEEQVIVKTENELFTNVDNELLKEHQIYKPNTINIDIKEFYLNNQYGFTDTIHTLLESIRDTDMGGESCDRSKEFIMLQHQKIVQTYLNSYTPYRGLLLYHGLGSGKTCSSIGILEGMKEEKKIYIITPASLQANYKTQMKFCGDKIFKYNNYWIFMKYDEYDDSIYQLFKSYFYLDEDYTTHIKKYVNTHGGIWLIKSGDSNYDRLHQKERVQISELIDILISIKYTFLNYNGINKKKWNTIKGTRNPFHNSVIVIDEAHNFVGQINNKLKTKSTSVSTDMYESILDAENCKVVLLSGTPYINYPSELGVMINLISGYTIEYEFNLNTGYNLQEIKDSLKEVQLYNIIDYTKSSIKIIRNPYGFITTTTGVKYDKPVTFDTEKKFIESIYKTLNKYKLTLTVHKYKRIPDEEREFNNLFVKTETEGINTGLKVINNKSFFQTRISGLISYLGDKTALMPRLEKHVIENIKMSSHQMSEYNKYKAKEKKNKTSKGDGSYKVFTRAACNFVFDDTIVRPFPEKVVSEKDFDYVEKQERLLQLDSFEEDGDKLLENNEYDKAINTFMKNVKTNREIFFFNHLKRFVDVEFNEPPTKEDQYGLLKYSPKFHTILDNIIKHTESCHLLYSSFRRVEGIEILRLLLKYQGFQELVVVKDKAGDWDVKLVSGYNDGTVFKETKVFALYTGTEDKEVKEIVRNIYNSNLDKLTPKLNEKLKILYKSEDVDNLHGRLINLLMITASGAEGIDLQNTRYVHITEPYWHRVRIDQVIGRARRICSHNRLPIEEQTVKVYSYISKFVLEDVKKDLNDMTTDEYLLKIMEQKRVLSESFLNTLKESAIDCVAGSKCFKFPKVTEEFKLNKAYKLDYKKDPLQKRETNTKYINMKLNYEGESKTYKVDTSTMPQKAYYKEKEVGFVDGTDLIKL